MKYRDLFFILTLIINTDFLSGQKTDANIFGDVQSKGVHLPYINVYVEGTNIGSMTDKTGHYMLINIPEGEHVIVASSIGYKTVRKTVVSERNKTVELNFELEKELVSLDEIVVTATKTFKRKTESAVIVNVLENKLFDLVQAVSVSEGLSFQPGLRIETDCQTCNYTQLRMNGMGGSYSQILINSRPVFSPLTGLYGLEQIPSNMVERIEIVRGGGSALYGSSAIGGTVNIITKIPENNSYELSINNSFINRDAFDNQINGNISVVSEERKSGVNFFASRRSREIYDHNNDGFSELPALGNNSFGLTSFLAPSNGHKIELSLSSINEYRYGGHIIEGLAHEAEQSEERTHNILMTSMDYEINFNNDLTTLINYIAWQNTDRKHYTGIKPDDSASITNHFLNPPYGITANNTVQIGSQINHKAGNFFGGTNTFTFGAEYTYDDVHDQIETYNYQLDQTTRNTGIIFQSDLVIPSGITFLTGIRADKHNLVNKVILNPRISLLYRHRQNLQLRASWSSGFRAPQAFDSDMHINFAGGGVSRIVLSPALKEERSQSYSASVNYDKPTTFFILGFTIEGFYTRLKDPFILEQIENDLFGFIYEKRNGTNSTVKGITLELRGNYNKKIQLETGMTLQSSYFAEPVKYSSMLPGTRKYLRSPDNYGYYTLSLTPSEKFSASVSGVYTGSMKLLHLAGAPENPVNDIFMTSSPFFENNLRISYLIKMEKVESGLELFGGVKNIFNAYQSDFDTGKYRDSNYIYGPGLPRSIYFGLKISSAK